MSHQENPSFIEEHTHRVEADQTRTLSRLNRRIEALRVRYGPDTVIMLHLSAYVPRMLDAPSDPTE
jgi:uncharacterized ParB-like nuclease family protein